MEANKSAAIKPFGVATHHRALASADAARKPLAHREIAAFPLCRPMLKEASRLPHRTTAREKMIRFLFRFVGFWILAGGFVALVVDGTRSIAASSLVVTPARSAWTSLSPASLDVVRVRASSLAPWLWDDLLSPILDLPLFLLLALIGLLVMGIGTARRRSHYDVR